ncbi:MAG: SEC-C domain-containing protein, partial [Elusimicrobia bacterium]|nr:SEC-C domain-containing protein [Elusimicrobiota bacterium]
LSAIAPPDSYPETWDIASLRAYLERTFALDWNPSAEEIARLEKDTLKSTLSESAREAYSRREEEFRGYDFREIERMILLQMIDKAWKGHLYDLDHLKKSIGLRAYGQKDPKIEYQKESFLMFEAMLARIREQSVEYVFKVQAPRLPPPPPAMSYEAPENPSDGGLGAAKPGRSDSRGHGLLLRRGGEAAAAAPAAVRKIGRNDPCYCGSGKKFKKCHGA